MTQTEEQRQELIAKIERVRQVAIDKMLEEMYQNPFWEARFSEKGEKHSRLDAGYHIKQLISAIALDMPSLSVDYYHWLQGLLIYRGMCTRHIQETIDGLARQFQQLLPNDWPVIMPYLKAGETGLAYEHPACQALARLEHSIAIATTNRALAAMPAANPSTRQACLRDHRYQLSYLCDSVSIYEGSFEKYITWMGGFLPTYGISLVDLYQDLEGISQEITSALAAEMARPFEKVIQRTLQQPIFISMQKNRSLQ